VPKEKKKGFFRKVFGKKRPKNEEEEEGNDGAYMEVEYSSGEEEAYEDLDPVQEKPAKGIK